MMHELNASRADVDASEKWFQFNYTLEREATDSRLNEDFFVEWLNRLWSLPRDCNRVFWLGLARLNELALLCAGNYADACEFSAAGDLLLNPRLIMIHLKGRLEPMVKKRHQALTRQMGPLVPGNRNVINWIKENTRLEVRQYALLPHLLNILSRSGCLSESYLDSVKARMDRIACTIAFLTANRLMGPAELCAALTTMTPAKRAELKQGMCCFDRALFSDLGREMHQVMHYGLVKGKHTKGDGLDPEELSGHDLVQPPTYAPERDITGHPAHLMRS